MFQSKISKVFEKFVNLRQKLGSIIDDVVSKFPKNKSFKDWKTKIKLFEVVDDVNENVDNVNENVDEEVNVIVDEIINDSSDAVIRTLTHSDASALPIVEAGIDELVEKSINDHVKHVLGDAQGVIDSWAEVLNYYEFDRDSKNSPYRLFFDIQIFKNYIEEDPIINKPKISDQKLLKKGL
ncbi:hypothetical protein L1887_02820 [Cichorium endivia]|nr:hypothetical protein L1887_02820 [Cichorium endivia]